MNARTVKTHFGAQQSTRTHRGRSMLAVVARRTVTRRGFVLVSFVACTQAIHFLPFFFNFQGNFSLPPWQLCFFFLSRDALCDFHFVPFISPPPSLHCKPPCFFFLIIFLRGTLLFSLAPTIVGCIIPRDCYEERKLSSSCGKDWGGR